LNIDEARLQVTKTPPDLDIQEALRGLRRRNPCQHLGHGGKSQRREKDAEFTFHPFEVEIVAET
jgi:hypothetical protein